MFWWLFSFLLYPLYYCVISHRQSNFIIGGHASIEQSQAARYKRQPATGDDNEQHLEMNRQLRLPFPEKIFSIPAGFSTGEALQQRWFINQLVIQPPLPARRIFSLSQSNLTTQLASCRKKTTWGLTNTWSRRWDEGWDRTLERACGGAGKHLTNWKVHSETF